MLTQECVQKICYFQRARTPPENRHINLYTFVHFVHFFASKDSVPRLKIAVHFCTLSIFHLSPKSSYPAWKRCPKLAYFLYTSVHFDRSDLVNLKNLLVHMNPNPGKNIHFCPTGGIKIMKNDDKNMHFTEKSRNFSFFRA